MKFGEVFDFRTAEGAKAFIGKKGVFSDSLRDICERPAEKRFGTLVDADGKDAYPFMRLDEDGRRVPFEFFRPILEEDELMTNRQLAEWVAKGYGEYTHEDMGIASLALVYYKDEEDNSVLSTTLIRRWRDTEWSKPTRAIYEEDCMPNTAINKEDCR